MQLVQAGRLNQYVGRVSSVDGVFFSAIHFSEADERTRAEELARANLRLR
ncbi:hypothetical protein SAMN06265219_102254 [Gracilimonas mengyeensis]|uniref:Uncharacterized protein n=1 Tax=Gracilimonas mengyeensis TaxID=1302730 RepID=A0A521BGM5_9BACT|nr:hypothetical protein SAMN06265219_102254 [Gracilimonas mengyeensis]